MSFETTVIRPAQENPDRQDVVAVYVPGIDANLNNTGDRVQEMTNQLGIPFVLTDLLQQRQAEVFGMTNREAHQPKGEVFETMSRRYADHIAEVLDANNLDQTVRLVMADSLGVPAAQGIQLHADPDQKFNAMLLRDGWNLGPSERAGMGYVRYGSYQVANIVRDLGNKIVGKSRPAIPEYGWSDVEIAKSETGLVDKVKNATDLMRSHETRDNALRLAALGGQAIYAVCLYPGLSGSYSAAEKFINDLHTASGENPQVQGRIVAGWHSDLLDPFRGAQDVENTLNLLNSNED